MNLERINASFSTFRTAAGLGDYDRLVALADEIAESGKAGPGGEFEGLFLLLADLIEAHDKRDHPVPDVTPAQALRSSWSSTD